MIRSELSSLKFICSCEVCKREVKKLEDQYIRFYLSSAGSLADSSVQDDHPTELVM